MRQLAFRRCVNPWCIGRTSHLPKMVKGAPTRFGNCDGPPRNHPSRGKAGVPYLGSSVFLEATPFPLPSKAERTVTVSSHSTHDFCVQQRITGRNIFFGSGRNGQSLTQWSSSYFHPSNLPFTITPPKLLSISYSIFSNFIFYTL